MKITPSSIMIEPGIRTEKFSPSERVLTPGAPLTETGLSRQKPLPDFLSRLLIALPGRGEILDRLSLIPAGERLQALSVLLVLEERNLSLNREEWNELWTLIRKKSAPFPEGENGVRQQFSQPGKGAGEELFLQDMQSKTIILIPWREEGRKGQLIIKSEEGSDNLFVRMETALRHWEFHLIKPRKDGILSTMEVFTNDSSLIDSPPGGWEVFRKKMKKKSIRVERMIKFLRDPLYSSENRRRELDHLVDIVL